MTWQRLDSIKTLCLSHACQPIVRRWLVRGWKWKISLCGTLKWINCHILLNTRAKHQSYCIRIEGPEFSCLQLRAIYYQSQCIYSMNTKIGQRFFLTDNLSDSPKYIGYTKKGARRNKLAYRRDICPTKFCRKRSNFGDKPAHQLGPLVFLSGCGLRNFLMFDHLILINLFVYIIGRAHKLPLSGAKLNLYWKHQCWTCRLNKNT